METPAPASDLHQRPLTRRDVLIGAAGATLATLAQKTLAIAQEPTTQSAPRTLGPGPTEIGDRSPFEKPRRDIFIPAPAGVSMTPLEDLHGIITPADLHFERHHGGIPAIDPAKYSLLIHGLVERPLKFTLDELKRFPSQSRICFIECSGNGIRGYAANMRKREATPGWLEGLISTSEWTGVPLGTLFREVGVKPEAKWFLAEGLDAVLMTRSVPIEKAFDDALIVYAQNGEAIRPAQGYPIRLLLPGWEGNAQVKWLGRLELADQPFMTREETSKYTDPLGDGTARLFSLVMDAKSIITFPAYPKTIAPGWWEVTGLAWSGRGKITRVEVSTNGGARWQDAHLEEPILSKCTTRFRHMWNYAGDEAVLMSRATDETGYVQPTHAQLAAVRGEGTFYHTNDIRAWKVERGGKVFFYTEV